MKINVLFFGITKEMVGKQQIDMDLARPTTVADFKTMLIEKYPKLSDLNAVAFAVNSEYAEDQLLIQAQDEVALIPPVSGG